MAGTDWREDPALPKAVRKTLATLTEELEAGLGDRLEAVLLYGPLARGDVFHAATTTVDVLIVLKEVAVQALDAISGPVRRAQRRLRVTTMIATAADIASSDDVFPSKFQDMKEHHRLLLGVDPLLDLTVDGEHLRLRCEQELKNLMLRLRVRYLHAHRARDLRQLLGDTGAAFADQLRCLLRVRGGEAPPTRAGVVEQVESLGLDKRVLEELLAIDRGGYAPSRDEARALLDRTIAAVGQAARLADTHETDAAS